MDALVAGLEGCAAYLDDVIVTGRTREEHDANIRNLFARINDYGFRVRLEKCSFAEEKIRFQGNIVDKEGRRPDPEKIAAIKEMPEPKNQQQLESFLGHAFNAAPLDALKKKDTEFIWSTDCGAAFKKLKDVLQSDLLLTHYDPRMEIIVAADACDYGIGAVISHRFPNGMEKAICHASRALTPAQKNYGQIDKEALALVFAVRKFHHYIYGRRFLLLTDHKPLLAVFGSKKGISVHSANRLQRWSLVLLAYDFDIQYRSTTTFGQSDALSRLIANQHVPEEDVVIARIEDDVAAVYRDVTKHLPVRKEDIRAALEKDLTLPAIVTAVKTGKWPAGKPGSPFANFYSRRIELSIFEGCLFMGQRIVVPYSLQGRMLKMLHEGHPGSTRMRLLGRAHVYWQGMDKDIEQLVKNCTSCQAAAKMPLKNELKPWPETDRAWERIHIDYAGPMEGRMFLVVVDAFSKWPEVVEMNSSTTTATIRQLNRLFSQLGYPETLVSDNGTQFTSMEFEDYCKMNGIKHIRTPPYHPQSNGQAERFVDIFKRSLQKLKGERSTSDMLQRFLITYRSTPCQSSPGQRSPAENFIGRMLRAPLSQLSAKKIIGTHLQEGTTKMEEQFNRHHGARQKDFAPDDLVYARDYKVPGKPVWTHGRVLKKIGRTIYEIDVQGQTWKRHANQLRKRHSDAAMPVLWDAFDLPMLENAGEEDAPLVTPTIDGLDPPAAMMPTRTRRTCGPPMRLQM